MPWHRTNRPQKTNFVNTPFCLILSFLSVVESQQAEATLIAPWWLGQPWFRKLLSITTSTPVHIPQMMWSFIQLETQEPQSLSLPHIHFQDIWQKWLAANSAAAHQLSYTWASSALTQYDNILSKPCTYCDQHGAAFPATVNTLVNPMESLSGQFEQPKSIMGTTSATITGLLHALDEVSPMLDLHIPILVTALVKSGAKLVRPSDWPDLVAKVIVPNPFSLQVPQKP